MFDDVVNNSRSSLAWFFGHDFHGIVLGAVSIKELASSGLAYIPDPHLVGGRKSAVYEFSMGVASRLEPPDIELFNAAFNVAELSPALVKIRDALCVCTTENNWHAEDAVRRLQFEAKRQDQLAKNRLAFIGAAEQIRTGLALNWMAWIAKIYFGLLVSDMEATPRERLQSVLGEDLPDIAIEGLISCAQSQHLPGPSCIAKSRIKGRGYYWWYAVLAGMDELWKRNPDLSVHSADRLAAALAIDHEYKTFEHSGRVQRETARGWRDALLATRPDFVARVYATLARAELHANSEHGSATYALCRTKQLGKYRASIALRLLRKFPSTSPSNLGVLLEAALSDRKAQKRLATIAKTALLAPRRLTREHLALWRATYFLVAYEKFRQSCLHGTSARLGFFWAVKELTSGTGHADKIRIELSSRHIEGIVAIGAKELGNSEFPRGGSSGSRNSWDASRFVRDLISGLSGMPSDEAHESLMRLRENRAVQPFLDYIRHALAVQSVLLRESRFKQPDWEETVRTLGGGGPANIADLHAIAVTTLTQMKAEIRHANTDQYRAFWNESTRGAVISPKSEESGRDRIIDLLKPKMARYDVHVEPEPHMAGDKRADIALIFKSDCKLVIEVKRDTNRKLWSACKDQLKRQYTPDPQASGYGIYLVLWFGHPSKRLPRPPPQISAPKSAGELEKVLRSMLKGDEDRRLEVIVLDVSKLSAGPKLRRRKNPRRQKP
jgi:hypothetical protein